LAGTNRVFSPKFKQAAVERMLNGECVSSLSAQLKIKRSVLYRWRDAFRREGPPGLARPVGRQPGVPHPRPPANAEQAAAERIAELERKIGQQALDLDFLRAAFKRVKESRPSSTGCGAKASTPKSGR